MNRLLLVDGNSIINRAYYALAGRATLTAPDGTPTGAVNGFFNSFLTVFDEYEATHACVLFDLKQPTFRHKMYPEYKAQRKPTDADLITQIALTKELLDLMGIARLELAGFEADDLIGTLSLMGEQQGYEVFIQSGDHDDFQLISDHVSVVMPQKGVPPRILFDRAHYEEKYGIKPEEFVAVKVMMGDSSDNIKGLGGIGEKTAYALVAEYKTLEKIVANADKLKPSVRSKFETCTDLIELNRKLCTIDRHVPIDLTLEECAYNGVPANFQEPLKEKLFELTLRSLTKKLKLDSEIRVSLANMNDEKLRFLKEFDSFKGNEQITLSPSQEKLEEFCANGYGIGFFSSSNSDYILFGKRNSNEFLCFNAKSFPTSVTLPTGAISFDYKDASKVLPSAINGIDSVFDTFICGQVVNLLSSSQKSFDTLFEHTFECSYPISQESNQPTQVSLFELESPSFFEEDSKRAAQMLYLNLNLALELDRRIKADNQTTLMYDIEFPLVCTLDSMERYGMHVDRDALLSLQNEFTDELSGIERQIYELVGCEFKVSSPKQVSEVLFEKLGFDPVGKKGKTGAYSTSNEVLTKLKARYDSPVISLIIKYREVSKLLSTYCVGLLSKIEADERIRTTFTQAMTNTGRLSSVNPNLQNIPVRSEKGGQIRKVFDAPKGKILVDADYSQIELRLLADMSGDEAMKEAFNSNVDIHKGTASKINKVPLDDVTPLMRRNAKAVNFGIIYGLTDFGLAEDLGVSFDEAARIRREYYMQFPKIKAYLESLQTQAQEQGEAKTTFGRVRKIGDLFSMDYNSIGFEMRVAMNTPIQGTAADIIKLSMNKVFNALKHELPNAKLIMQVHDELIIECDEADCDKASKLLKREMEGAVTLSVPLTVDVHSGSNWLEAK